MAAIFLCEAFGESAFPLVQAMIVGVDVPMGCGSHYIYIYNNNNNNNNECFILFVVPIYSMVVLFVLIRAADPALQFHSPGVSWGGHLKSR